MTIAGPAPALDGQAAGSRADAALVTLFQVRRDAGADIRQLRVAQGLKSCDVWELLQDSVEIEYF